MSSTVMVQENKAQTKSYIPYLLVVLGFATPIIQIIWGTPLETYLPFPFNRFLSLLPFWIIGGGLLYYSVKVEGIPLSTFGIGKNHRSLRYRLIEMIAALILAFVMLVIVIMLSNAVRSALNMPNATMQINLEKIIPFWVSFPAWLTAGFMEEFLFRVYPIERLNLLNGKPRLAALVSGILFVVLHGFAWDWIHLLTVGVPATLLISAAYLWRRSFWFVAVMHLTMDLPILLLPFIAPFMAQ